MADTVKKLVNAVRKNPLDHPKGYSHISVFWTESLRKKRMCILVGNSGFEFWLWYSSCHTPFQLESQTVLIDHPSQAHHSKTSRNHIDSNMADMTMARPIDAPTNLKAGAMCAGVGFFPSPTA